MERLEYILTDKIGTIVNYGLERLIRPDLSLSDVTVLNKGIIRWIKEKYGIEGVVLDVDETIRKGGNQIPKCNKDWIEAIKDELKVIILTNGWSREIEEYFSNMNIDYIKLAWKPASGGFKKACNRMNLEPSKVLMIGNDLFSDIYGGRRNKMRTALVKSVRGDEER